MFFEEKYLKNIQNGGTPSPGRLSKDLKYAKKIKSSKEFVKKVRDEAGKLIESAEARVKAVELSASEAVARAESDADNYLQEANERELNTATELNAIISEMKQELYILKLENKDLRERLSELEQSNITLSPPIQRKQISQQDSKKLIKVEYDHLNRDINEMSKMVISSFSKLKR